ncbi:alginate lyase family protein, partial [Bradyrhizobium sp. Pear76]|uniref:alginate lyase family protein n=1 Tax=Bradyrhizobium oropedii TaxID=1571201 RepID=UPI001E35D513
LMTPSGIVGFRGLVAAVSCSVLVATADIAHAKPVCPSIPPMPTLELKSMYSDSKGSVVDNANEDANAEIMAPIFTFFRTMERALDGANAHPGSPDTDCAFQLFGRWAKAGALTFEPQVYEGQGKVKRGLLNPAFQMIGIKFRAAGYTLNGTMLAWLRQMDQENIEFYAKGTNRANQRVWAATGAALNNVLERDPVALAFQNQVWHEALAAIDNDGFIAAELERGSQALVYHIYSLSATLVLEAARNALGYSEPTAERQRVKKLAVAIGETLCDSHKMEELAKAKIRIPDGQWAYEVMNGFGGDRFDANWSRCGLAQTDFNARDMGGDSRRSVAILSGLHR